MINIEISVTGIQKRELIFAYLFADLSVFVKHHYYELWKDNEV